MFKSATLRLTGWYLLILMSISIVFSVTIFNTTSIELSDRLQQLQMQYEHPEMSQSEFTLPPQNQRYSNFRTLQRDEASRNILFSLIYVNLFIFVAGGAVSYWLARRTLHEIETVHEAQSRFTSDASHELRTPLAVMKTELEVALRDSNLSPEEMREILESNLEEVDKLSRLSMMLLQLSKAEYSELDKKPLDMITMVRDVVQRQDKTGKRIKIKHPTELPKILGNDASIEELMTILIDNAIKYSPDSSVVTIRLSKRSGKVCFEITNTGKGISAEDLPKVFDRFYRADSSRTNGATSGYGLGLSLAKKIVEIHQGELSATSAPDHATTFTVLLHPIRATIGKK